MNHPPRGRGPHRDGGGHGQPRPPPGISRQARCVLPGRAGLQPRGPATGTQRRPA
eukprot:CAMPEP_0206025722 /NCGR_PEP_ID=MMETSP1464-20131121/40558_1 /ASSEMBLY_ACC=CAM_ASM_001124 /TAXON_ID=119497 /ORGANISM="Exanthemachrysis gayraliae, Strain RCC1523" /LENGTH=54 /DNA_ID=CAMNT_0053399757 /DNA_START=121 /DNA_END=282 /DNA_ORIENTATION=-